MIYYHEEGDTLRNGINIYTRSRFHIGFIAKLGSISFGIRWQKQLRRLYVRYGGVSRVLIGKNRSYSNMRHDGSFT